MPRQRGGGARCPLRRPRYDDCLEETQVVLTTPPPGHREDPPLLQGCITRQTLGYNGDFTSSPEPRLWQHPSVSCASPHSAFTTVTNFTFPRPGPPRKRSRAPAGHSGPGIGFRRREMSQSWDALLWLGCSCSPGSPTPGHTHSDPKGREPFSPTWQQVTPWVRGPCV